MRVERFYHSAPSAAESNSEPVRAMTAAGSEFALPAHAFPQGLEAAVYALRKRLICPRWWLTGVMSQWLAKDSEQLVLQLGLRDEDWVLSGPAISSKCFPVVVGLWTEIFAQISKSTSSEGFSLELDLSRLLRGTSSEVDAQREFLTGYLSSALRVQRVRTVQPRSQGKRTKAAAHVGPHLMLEPVGLVQIVENVVLKHGTEDRLLVNFANDPRRLFSDSVEELLPASLLSCLKSEKTRNQSAGPVEFGAAVVSLQPDVLQAFSRATSPKKLCSYLTLELMKKSDDPGLSCSSSESEQVWRGRALGLKELPKMHKEQLVKAQTFYDHGILSWENEAPKQRVRHLVHGSPQQADSGIVQCWRMSQHALDAVQFERALSGVLRQQDTTAPQLAPAASRVMLEAAPVAASQVVIESPFAELQAEARELLKSQDTVNVQELSKSPNVAKSPEVTRSSESFAKNSVDVLPAQPASSGFPRISPSSSSGFGAQRRVPVLDKSSLTVEQGAFVRNSSARPVAQTVTRDVSNSPKNNTLSDDDFLMCVAEFYESLTPLQQQAFERERRKMSPEQFKMYVMPALLRLRGRG